MGRIVKPRLSEGVEGFFLTADVEIIIDGKKIWRGWQSRGLTAKILCWETTCLESAIS